MVLKGTIEELKLKSSTLQTDVEAMVYLPPHYSPLYTYPLIIAQDGQDYFNLGRIASLTDQLLMERRIRDVIIVGLPYEDKRERWHRYHPDGDFQEAYLRFMTREVLPAVEKQYAVDYLASERFLIGDSLGGSISFNAALRYPHTFGNVIMQSPFVNEAMIGKVKGFDLPSQISIYHSIGTNETAVETTWGQHADFLEPNRRLQMAINEKPFASYTYVENEGNHTWTYWQGDLENALLTLFKP
jgi:enterochelin esterase-like enzyme